MKPFPVEKNLKVQSIADGTGRRMLTISDALTHPNALRRIPAKRRRRVVLSVTSAPEELTAFTPVIRVRS